MTLSRRSVLHGGALGAAIALLRPPLAFARRLLTDATGQGSWSVENGAVAGPVNHFRFNEPPVQMLARCDALGAPYLVGDPRMRVLASVAEAV